MFDSKGRKIHYLRLSVTDLCNLRCRYCMPDGVDKLEREDILTYEEFLRLAALFARCGVDTVRVTGGEPLVRKGVEQLVKGLKAIPGIRKVTMTTNAVLLEQQLPALLEAGLGSVNISLDTLDNRKSNLRICTHQQNQCNQPLQCNNTSGVSGVSFYAPRGKYRARIKIGQHDIHLGYYSSFAEAVQARNVGMECMFGEYGRYNDAAPEPAWIRTKATEQCGRFAELSLCKAFRLCGKSQKGGDSHGDGWQKAEAHGAEGAGRRPGQGTATSQRA